MHNKRAACQQLKILWRGPHKHPWKQLFAQVFPRAEVLQQSIKNVHESSWRLWSWCLRVLVPLLLHWCFASLRKPADIWKPYLPLKNKTTGERGWGRGDRPNNPKHMQLMFHLICSYILMVEELIFLYLWLTVSRNTCCIYYFLYLVHLFFASSKLSW